MGPAFDKTFLMKVFELQKRIEEVVLLCRFLRFYSFPFRSGNQKATDYRRFVTHQFRASSAR